MIEDIPIPVFLAVGGAIGATVRGILGYIKAKEKKKKTKFDAANFLDSVWQGALLGYTVSIAGINFWVSGLAIGLVSGWTGSSVGDKLKLDIVRYSKAFFKK